jgi:hypothetical protein
MTLQEEARVRSWNRTLSRHVSIGLRLTEDGRSSKFEAFCDDFSRVAQKVAVIREEGEPKEPPSIQIGQALRYHAIPLGTELKPFLDAISGLDKEFSVPLSVQSSLQAVRVPADLSIFIAQQCPFCPLMVRQLIPLAGANEFVQLTIVDCALFPEMAQENRIQSVPTVVLDRQFWWTGTFPLEELLRAITDRDPAKLGTSSLENMLKQGDAARIAKMMLDEHRIFPTFIPLLTHEKWPVRLGAMVTLEEIVRQAPEIAAQVVDPLWERFADVEDPVKGDIMYVMGEIGNSEVTPRLETVLKGPYHHEVKEAAKEALEKIRKSLA